MERKACGIHLIPRDALNAIINTGKYDKLFRKIVSGRSDANIAFDELWNLLLRLDFEERSEGSPHIFTRIDIEELINLQRDGAKAKPYQVRQVRDVIARNDLSLES